MISPLLEAYNIQKQVSSGLYVVQREGDKEWAARLKSMLATQDIWEQQWDDTVTQVETLLCEMKAFMRSSNEVRFADEADKNAQIASLESGFDAESRHRHFEKLLRRLMRTMDLLHDLHGLTKIDLDAPENVLIIKRLADQLQERLLPSESRAGRGLSAAYESCEWSDEGLVFKFAVSDGRGAGSATIAHTVPMVCSNLLSQGVELSFQL